MIPEGPWRALSAGESNGPRDELSHLGNRVTSRRPWAQWNAPLLARNLAERGPSALGGASVQQRCSRVEAGLPVALFAVEEGGGGARGGQRAAGAHRLVDDSRVEHDKVGRRPGHEAPAKLVPRGPPGTRGRRAERPVKGDGLLGRRGRGPVTPLGGLPRHGHRDARPGVRRLHGRVGAECEEAARRLQAGQRERMARAVAPCPPHDGLVAAQLDRLQRSHDTEPPEAADVVVVDELGVLDARPGWPGGPPGAPAGTARPRGSGGWGWSPAAVREPTLPSPKSFSQPTRKRAAESLAWGSPGSAGATPSPLCRPAATAVSSCSPRTPAWTRNNRRPAAARRR